MHMCLKGTLTLDMVSESMTAGNAEHAALSNKATQIMGQAILADLSDADLVQLCIDRGARDERPFQELFRRHQKLVWRVCYGFTRNAADAEDLTQEVFVKIYRNLHKFEGRSQFTTWLYRIAVNTCQNELRRRQRRPQEAAAELETVAEFVPSGQSVERSWQEQRTSEMLLEAIARLPEDAQEIIVMKDVEERPYAEIADLLGIGLSAAKMRAQRARHALQVAYRLVEQGL
jgi:RNA polymerase sigma-70 factor (ECF subfamily)